jgi:hypothetical protein
MRRIATAVSAGMVAAMLLPAGADAAFGPALSIDGFNRPQSAAATNATVYVADTANNRVASYSPAGAFEGNLSSPPSAPQDVAANGPLGLVVAAGPSQVVRWLFGAPLAFNPPGTSYGVAVDPSGNIYVSDTQARVIHRFNGLGVPQADIGAGQLAQPQGLTTDGAGSIYVADPGNGRIVRFDPAGNVTGIWGMPTYTIVAGGQKINGRIEPHDVAVDGSGRVFAPDAGTRSNLVAVFGPGGDLQQIFGSPESDPGNPCQLRGPWGLGISPGGTLYVASTGENRIRVFDESHAACPFPNLGPGGGIRGPDRKRPKIKLKGLPKKCARGNFTLKIRATDDVQLRRFILLVNRRKVANQRVNKRTWTVKVNFPARRVSRQLPRGASVRVLIEVRVTDTAGKKARAKRSFRICG